MKEEISLNQAGKALMVSMAIAVAHAIKSGKLPNACMVPFVLDGEDLVPMQDDKDDDGAQALINKGDMAGLAYAMGSALALPKVKAVVLMAGAMGIAQRHGTKEEAVAKLEEIQKLAEDGKLEEAGLTHFLVGLLVTPNNSIHAMWDGSKVAEMPWKREVVAEAAASVHVSTDPETFMGPVTPAQIQDAYRNIAAAREYGIH